MDKHAIFQLIGAAVIIAQLFALGFYDPTYAEMPSVQVVAQKTP